MRVKILVVIFQVIAKLWEKRLVLIMNPLPKGMMIQESDQRRRFVLLKLHFIKLSSLQLYLSSTLIMKSR